MGVLDWFISNAEAALVMPVRDRGLSRIPPLLLVASLIVSWTGMALVGVPVLIGWLPYVVTLHLLSSRERITRLVRTLSLPMVMIGFIGGLLSPYRFFSSEWVRYWLTVVLRAYMYSSTGFLVFTGLGPHGSQRFAARIGASFHDVMVLFYRQTPQLLRDLEEALIAQGLLGFKPHEALAGVTLEGLRRSEMARVSLYLRGAGPGGSRTPLPGPSGGGGYSWLLGVVVFVMGLAPLVWFAGLILF